jgi:hypothetical protein
MIDSVQSENLAERPSTCAKQIREGFFRLKFQPELERGFKEYFLDIHVSRVRFTLSVAVVLTLLFSLTDHLRLPADIVALTYPARIAQVSGLLLIWLVIRYEIRQYLAATVTLVLLIFGVSIPLILGQINVANSHSPIHALTLYQAKDAGRNRVVLQNFSQQRTAR